MSLLKNYYVQLTLLGLIAISLSANLYLWLPTIFNAPTWWIAPLFFVITTLASHFILTRGDKTSKEFVQKIMASSVGRLLLSMIIVLIYSKLDKPHGMAFAFHFMLQYVLFTVFEIAYFAAVFKAINLIHSFKKRSYLYETSFYSCPAHGGDAEYSHCTGQNQQKEQRI